MLAISRRILLLALGAQAAAAPLIEVVRKELLTLPYYGCFDFLTFKLDGTVVTLGGYALRPTTKEDAERVLKDIEQISKIENEIEVLPLSPGDDRIRWAVFRAIYRDPVLGRYKPGGPFNRHYGGVFFGGPFERWNMPSSTMEPLGSFPIHVVVKGGNVILVGIVDNKADSDRANILANGVSGIFNVKNLLEVDPGQTSPPKRSQPRPKATAPVAGAPTASTLAPRAK